MPIGSGCINEVGTLRLRGLEGLPFFPRKSPTPQRELLKIASVEQERSVR